MIKRRFLTTLWVGILLVSLVAQAQAQAPAGITGVSPAEGTVGAEVTLTGVGFGEKHGEVLLGEQKCRVLDWSDTEITFLVDKPQQADEYSVTVLLQGDKKPVEPVMFDAFTLRRPRITPEELIQDGATATIVGEFFGDKKGEVRLGYLDGGVKVESAKVLDWSMNTIRFELPEELRGRFVLAVRNEVGTGLALYNLGVSMPGSVNPVPDLGGFESWENASGIYYKGKFYVFDSRYHPGFDDNWRIRAWTFDPGDGSFTSISPPEGQTEVPLQPLVIGDTLWVFRTGHRWGENICCVTIWYTTYTYDESTRTGTWDPAGWQEIPTHEIDEKATVAPVYDPATHRISVYYAHDGYLVWFKSDDFGAQWSRYVVPKGGPPAVSGKFVHALNWPTATTTALVAADGQVFTVYDGSLRQFVGQLPPNVASPFLVDLGGKTALLYRDTDTYNIPKITTLDHETWTWSAPKQLVPEPETGFPLTEYDFTWAPRGAINQVPNLGGLDSYLYIFYGVHFRESLSDGTWDRWYMHNTGKVHAVGANITDSQSWLQPGQR